MLEIGFTLSSEEFGPLDLVRQAGMAEEAGFTFALISDQYHPWIDRQGHSPFVWGVLGGISQATSELRLGTGVTCPSFRVHPAIVAQAAATAGCLLPGRFFLGVGSGENLNEHVVSSSWPSAAVRQDRLAEAIRCIRTLWEGGPRSWRGEHFTVENARVYDLPEQPVPIYVAAAGTKAATMAAQEGDGLIGVSPEADVIKAYEAGGGRGPRYGQLHVCWAEDAEEAARTAFETWPNVAIPGELGQELPLPRHFEQAAQTLREEDVAGMIPTGPDPEPYLDAIRTYQEAGFDHVYLHQIGHDQEGFLRFAQAELLPKVG